MRQSNNFPSSKPIQRLPESSKDRAWRRASLQYWNQINMNDFSNARDFKDLELAAGKITLTDYTYITNPFGLKDKKYQNYPAKLRNFDFISPLFLRWISEFNQRNFEPTVYTKNSNFDNEKLAYEKSLIEQSMQQRFINLLIKTGGFDPSQIDEAGNPVQEPMSPEVIKGQTSSLKDKKTIMGQHAMDYILDKQDVKAKCRKAFEYFIKINKCVTFRDVRFDEVIYEPISPLNVRYYGNRNITYLEDCEAITVDYYLTFEEVLELFGNDLEEYEKEYGNIIDILEYESARGNDISYGSYFHSIYMRNMTGGMDTNKTISEDKRINVRHIQFTSFRKVKRVLGENDEILNLTEDYQGDDIIEEVWYPEEREGWVIANRFFIGGYPCDIQRVDSDNPFSSKKNYNGRIFLQGDVEQLTPPQRLYQYQEAHNAVQFKMQAAINKDKGKIVTMPLSLMKGLKNTRPTGNLNYTFEADENGNAIYGTSPSNQDSREDSQVGINMYYADVSQVMFLDDSDENIATAVNAIKQIDLSLGNWIEWLAARADKLKLDAENLLGFNSARTGAIKSTDSVSNAQQNLYSGSLITEEYFTEFEEFMNKDFQGLLDLSKYAFRSGKKAHFVRSNTDIAVLQIDEGFSEASYGVFVKSSAKTKEVLDTLKMQATQILQNSPKGGSTIAKVLAGSTNAASIVEELEAKENEMFEAEQRNQEADRQNALQIAQINEQSKQADRDLKRYEIDSRQETEIIKQGILASGFNIGKEGGEEIATKMLAETNKMLDAVQKNNLKQQEIDSKERIATQNNKTKIEVANKQLQVAKTNPG